MEFWRVEQKSAHNQHNNPSGVAGMSENCDRDKFFVRPVKAKNISEFIWIAFSLSKKELHQFSTPKNKEKNQSL